MTIWWSKTKKYVTGLTYAAALIVSILEFIATDYYYKNNQKHKTIAYHQIGFSVRFASSIILICAFLMWHKPSNTDLFALLLIFLVNVFQIISTCYTFKSFDFTKWRIPWIASSRAKLLNWNDYTQTIILIVCIIAAIMGCKNTLKRVRLIF